MPNLSKEETEESETAQQFSLCGPQSRTFSIARELLRYIDLGLSLAPAPCGSRLSFSNHSRCVLQNWNGHSSRLSRLKNYQFLQSFQPFSWDSDSHLKLSPLTTYHFFKLLEPSCVTAFLCNADLLKEEKKKREKPCVILPFCCF